jgi:O-antigen/teichoic acid export membrane protein
MLGISSIGIREIAKHKDNQEELDKTFTSLFCLTGLATLIALIVLFVCTYTIPDLYKYKTMLAIGGLKILSNFLLIEWFFKGLEEFKFITQRTLIVKTIYVISVFLFVKTEEDYQIYYVLLTLMITLNAICNMWYARKYVHLRFNTSMFLFLKAMLTMWIYSILTNMYTTFNTTYLGFQAGETQVGYFSTATKIFGLLIALYSAFTGVMLPRMSQLVAKGDNQAFEGMLKKSKDMLLSFSVPIVLLSVVYAKDIIFIISGEGYDGAILPMQICMSLIFVIGYEQILIVQGLLPLKQDKAVLYNSILGATVGVVGCLILIPMFKSVGASIVWLLSEVAVLILANYNINKVIKSPFPFKDLFKNIAYYVPLLAFVTLINQLEFNWLVRLSIGGLVSLVYFIFIQYKIVKNEEFMKLIGILSKKLK